MSEWVYIDLAHFWPFSFVFNFFGIIIKKIVFHTLSGYGSFDYTCAFFSGPYIRLYEAMSLTLGSVSHIILF